jgi:hypothetical protein
MKKIVDIFISAIPALLMIGLIPLIKNDYWLSLFYILIIGISFIFKLEKKDLVVFSFGFFGMVASEYLFISTGVEVFIRNSLFGLMPLWLPLLWGYGFVVIKRSVRILEN